MNLARLLHLKPQHVPLAFVSVIAGMAVAAYMQALHYPFISDDIAYIVRNSRLAELNFTGLWRLATEPYNDLSEFLPLRDLSYWFDLHLFGGTPAAFRSHNIILYVLCLPLVYAVTLGLWRYFRPADAASAPWAAAAVTALFALHPAHVEAVVWVSGRKDVLSSLFSLLALWLALHARRDRGLAAPYAVAALCALLAAMLSKATAVAVAPVIALLWVIFWRTGSEQGRPRLQLVWPLACLVLAACFAMLFSANSMVKEPVYYGVEAITRMLAVLGSLARLSLSPESRHFYYPVFEDVYLSYRVVLGIAVVAAAFAGLAAALRKRSLEGFILVVFLLLCMPYTQLLPYDTDSLVSDRFLALAVWPAALLITLLVWRLSAAYRTVILVVVAMLWGMQTFERPRDWRSFEALVEADFRAYPGYYMPAAYKITSFQLPQGLYGEAAQTAKRITSPEFRDVMSRMVGIHYLVHAGPAEDGKLREAMAQLWSLGNDIRLPPAQAQWNSPVKNLWIKLPYLLAAEWQVLDERYPGDASVRYNAGMWMLDAHRYRDAAAYLDSAATSDDLPRNLRGVTLGSLGLALVKLGRTAEAEASLRAALEQSPPDPLAHCKLLDIYVQTNRPVEARAADAGCRNARAR